MNASSRWIAPALSFLLSGATGWTIAGSSRREAEPPSGPLPLQGKSLDRSQVRMERRGIPDEVSVLLAPLRAAKSPGERTRAAAELALSVPVHEIGHWYTAGWIGAEGSPESNVFFRITRDRWLAEDAEGLMSFLVAHEHRSLSNTAETWANRDPEAALEFLGKERNSIRSWNLHTAVAMGLKEDTDPELLLAALGKIGGKGKPTSLPFAQRLVKLCIKSAPDRLATESAGWPSEVRQLAMLALRRQELEDDPAAALEQLRNDPEGRQFFIKALQEGGSLLAKMLGRIEDWPEGALSDIADRSPAYLIAGDPGRWLGAEPPVSGLSDAQWAKVRQVAIRQMIFDDPKTALTSLLATKLSPEERQMVIQQAFQKAALEDGPLPSEMLAQLSEPAEIAAAEQAIESNRKPQERTEQGPAGPADWVDGMIAKGSEEKPDGFYKTPNNWSAEEQEAARQHFKALPAEDKLKAAKGIARAFRSDQEHLSADAITYLVERQVEKEKPGELSPTMAASMLMSQWGDHDPAEASRWAESLPAGKLRTTALRSLAEKWSEYDPAEARRWLATLPEPERADTQEHIEQRRRSRP